LDHGGLALSRPIASAVIAAIMIGLVLLIPQRAGVHTKPNYGQANDVLRTIGDVLVLWRLAIASVE
jgi:hypothetical protein